MFFNGAVVKSTTAAYIILRQGQNFISFGGDLEVTAKSSAEASPPVWASISLFPLFLHYYIMEGKIDLLAQSIYAKKFNFIILLNRIDDSRWKTIRVTMIRLHWLGDRLRNGPMCENHYHLIVVGSVFADCALGFATSGAQRGCYKPEASLEPIVSDHSVARTRRSKPRISPEILRSRDRRSFVGF